MALDGAGFHVDIDVLEGAAKSIRAVMREQDGRELSELPGADEVFGDDDLASAFSTFCERWSAAVDECVKEGQETADALSSSAAVYRETDEVAAMALTKDSAVDEADG